MKSIVLFAFAFAMLLPSVSHAQLGKKIDLYISNDVLKTAEWAAFNYMESLDLAQTGDQKGLKDFLEFSRALDGGECIDHAVTCIELIKYCTDEKMGAVIYILKPKLKTILLDRFQLAQAQSKKEELHKPMQEWAPLTWKALHGEKVTCSSCNSEAGTTKSNGKKPISAMNAAESTEPATGTETKGKQ